MNTRACTKPLRPLFIRLYFKPIIIFLFIELDIGDDSLQLFFESIFPLLVFRTSMDS